MSLFTSWFLVYIAILLLYNISPSVSFAIITRNTISLKIGISTSIGVAACNFLFAIIGSLFCFMLNKHRIIFQYCQILGMSYLLYIGIKMLKTQIETNFDKKKPLISKKTIEAYKDGFLYTFSNINIAMTIITIISQFYSYIDKWYLYLIFILCVPLASFLSSMIVVICYFFKLRLLFDKYAYLINKIVGFTIILLITTNIRNILN